MPPEDDELTCSLQVDVVRMKGGVGVAAVQPVATEVPCTIIGNGVEIATLLCSPSHLKELAVGFLLSSAFIHDAADVHALTVDTTHWTVTCTLSQTPAPERLARRMYTSGCGRGVVYADLSEAGTRQPLASPLRLTAVQVASLARWLQHCSALYRDTGGTHTAAISEAGALPGESIDDVARHCAVDKVIGRRLLDGKSFDQTVLICSGRISAEIISKARRAEIAILVSRGGPTHQAILRARDAGITLIGFARGADFTVYSHAERVVAIPG
jgi:FdhD protein